MKRDDNNYFRPKLGRAHASEHRRHGPVIKRAARDAAKVGAGTKARVKPGSERYNRTGRGAPLMLGRRLGFAPGFSRQPGARRVIVKAHIVKFRGARSRAAAAHLRYLQREGVTRDGAPGRLYNATDNQVDRGAFLERGRDDPHQFRFIVAPEDALELTDLRDFTRDLVAQMEQDLYTKLDWVAVDHYNTEHPHTHIVVRGRDPSGEVLKIAGDYIAYGIRERASEVATIELGLQSEHDIQQKLSREVDQDRFTRVDRAILEQAEDRMIDVRPDFNPRNGAFNRHLQIGRLQHLRDLEMASEIEPGIWRLDPQLETRLREMGERGDIINTMHRAMRERGVQREAGQLLTESLPDHPIIGEVIDKGLADELGDRAYLVIDGVDGRAHYVRVGLGDVEHVPVGGIISVAAPGGGARPADRTIARLAGENRGIYDPSRHLGRASREPHARDPVGYVEAHVRRLEALRRRGIVERLPDARWRIPDDFLDRAGAYEIERRGGIEAGLKLQSSMPLEHQVAARGATWLDRQLVSPDRTPLAPAGFGAEVRDALEHREAQLIQQGLARRRWGRTRYQRDLLATLEQRELDATASAIARETGLDYHAVEPGDRISGRYSRRISLASGEFALVENAREFALVPWRPFMERSIGREVAGLVRDGGISWEVVRDLGLGL